VSGTDGGRRDGVRGDLGVHSTVPKILRFNRAGVAAPRRIGIVNGFTLVFSFPF